MQTDGYDGSHSGDSAVGAGVAVGATVTAGGLVGVGKLVGTAVGATVAAGGLVGATVGVSEAQATIDTIVTAIAMTRIRLRMRFL